MISRFPAATDFLSIIQLRSCRISVPHALRRGPAAAVLFVFMMVAVGIIGGHWISVQGEETHGTVGTHGPDRLAQALQERDAVIDRLEQRVDLLEAHLSEQSATHAAFGAAYGANSGSASIPIDGQTFAMLGSPLGFAANTAGTAPSAPGAPGKGSTPARAEAPSAPGQIEVVDEDEIERALERTLVQAGVLLLPAGRAEIQPDFSFTRIVTRNPTLINLNGNINAVAASEVRRNEFDAALAFRLGLPLDSQFELDLPIQYVRRSSVVTVEGSPLDDVNGDAFAVGDVRVALAKALVRENGWRPDIVGRIAWSTNTGTRIRNGIPMGGGFHEFRGALNLLKRQDPLAFIANVSYETSLENDGFDAGDAFGLSLGVALAASPETSLRFVFDQSFRGDARIEGRTLPGSDQVVAVLSVGASSILGSGVLLDISAGMGLTSDSPDYFVRAALPIRLDTPLRGVFDNWNL